MPTGAVMDAFKNLIRHGKNARAAPAQPVLSDPTSTATLMELDRDHREQKDQRRSGDRHRKHERAPVVEVPQQPPTPAGATREAAEYIVKQEREEKNKMPHYAGLENFKLIEKMGDGAFSNVYKAINRSTGEKVAIKVVRKYELNSTQDGNKHLNEKFKQRPRVTERANILKEVKIMRDMDHPSIVKLLSFSESREYYFLILELMEGGELFHQIVKLTYFSEALARHVILQVANGIRYLHEERGVIHRDIKPENLLFERIPIIPSNNPTPRKYDEDKEDEGDFIPGVGGGGIGRVKIADFGLSKVVWNEETKTPCGTVGYTAPEIVKDERYSKSVDMWALGCVLYTLLCGFPPFYDESINVLTEKVAKGYYTFLSPWWDEISSNAKDLITHLLCVDPDQRYTIDEFLAHPWCHAAPAPAPQTPSLEVKPVDSPLLQSLRGNRLDVRSPGVATLKEAFDVTYAVHRMEEEGARRRAYNGPGGAGARGFLHGLNEEEEEEEEEEAVVQVARKKHGAQVGQALEDTRMRERGRADRAVVANGAVANAATASRGRVHEGRAGPRDRGTGGGRGGFELDMNKATLLGRRHQRGGDAVVPIMIPQPGAVLIQ